MASFATKNNSDSFLPNPNLGFLNMNVFSHKKNNTNNNNNKTHSN